MMSICKEEKKQGGFFIVLLANYMNTRRKSARFSHKRINLCLCLSVTLTNFGLFVFFFIVCAYRTAYEKEPFKKQQLLFPYNYMPTKKIK